jgi:glycerol-3-phosphate dehydrogenase (NAD(P)+)
MSRISILGDGGWGTALGMLFNEEGHQVTVWGPFREYIEQVKQNNENKFYLPGIKLPKDIVWTADTGAVVKDADIIVLAVPSKYCRKVFKMFAGKINQDCPVVSVSKGLDPVTGKRITQVAEEELGSKSVAVLSGPSFAIEVAQKVPTAVVVACSNSEIAVLLQNAFMSKRFRVYTSDDVTGVEMGGVLKNVIAIAVGACNGLGYGNNTRAALITRGLAETTRIGVACGARAQTFAGLSGLGDMILTCTSSLSRNYTIGEKLGKGEKLASMVSDMKQVAEGISNAKIIYDIACEKKVRAPITKEVYQILYHNKKPEQAVHALLERTAKPEYE